jgi:D-arginine dehydrogenase
MGNERIVIVGGGIAGLSTAWFLARAGARDVVLVEREPALARHATAQNAAILRTAGDDPALVRLAVRSARFLTDPPAGFDQPLLERCGMVLMQRAGAGEPVCDHASGRPERMSPARLCESAPTLAANRGTAWWLPSEGRVNLAALVSGFERGGRDAGVHHMLGRAVRAMRPDGRGVELDDGTTIESDHVVIAAGAWAASLARSAGSRVELRPTRRHLMVTRADPRIDPSGPIVWSDVDDVYARPENGGLMLCPCDEEAIDPDSLCVSVEALALAQRKCVTAFDGFEPRPPARAWAGLRTHAADRRFVLGRDPDVPGLVWAAGLGGHGITCAAAVGEIAAAAVLGREMPSELVEPFSPARFAPSRFARGEAREP